MATQLSRLGRTVLTTILISACVLLIAAPVRAQQTLTIWGHAVHQQVAEGKRGGAEVNIAAEHILHRVNVELQAVAGELDFVLDPLLNVFDKVVGVAGIPEADEVGHHQL